MKMKVVAAVFAAFSCLVSASCEGPEAEERLASARQPADRGDGNDPLVIVVRGERLDLSHLDLEGRERAMAMYAELQAAVKRVAEAADVEENDRGREEELNDSILEQDAAANHAREKLKTVNQRLAELIQQQKDELRAHPPHDCPFDDLPLKVNSHVINAAKRDVDEAELLVRLSKKGNETILAPLRAQIEEINANRIARSEAIANDKTTIARLQESLLGLAQKS